MSFELFEQEIGELRRLQCNVSGRTGCALIACVLKFALDSGPKFVAKNLGVDVSPFIGTRVSS